MSDRRPRDKPARQPGDGAFTRGQRRARTPLLIFGALALIFVGVFATVNLAGRASDVSELQNGRGVVVEGTVVDTIQQAGSRRGVGIGTPRIYRYCPEYRFETLDGDIYRMESNQDCSEDADEPPLGSHAEIIYDPRDPTISHLNNTTGFAGAIVLGGGPLLVGVAMIGFYIWIKLPARRGKRGRR